jgi:16S rRNA G966 N2-methylase RsmD
VIRENLRSLGLTARAEVVQGRALQYLRHRSGGIVFLDPPYALEQEYAEALSVLGEAPPPLVVAQHASRFALGEVYGGLRRARILKQGDNALSFYRPEISK